MGRFFALFLALALFGMEGVLIPFYHYPSFEDSKIKKLIALRQSYPYLKIFAVINPNNGNFTQTQRNFASMIFRLHRAGIIPLGYLYTSYARRDLNESLEVVQKWKRYYGPYGIEGLFIDEVNQSALGYYRTLAQEVKKRFSYVVLNPGVEVSKDFFDIADIVVTKESAFVAPCRYQKKSALLLHSQNEFNESHKRLLECYDYVYITDQKMPHPWGEVSAFLEVLLQKAH